MNTKILWSDEQLAIFDTVAPQLLRTNSFGNFIVEAVAGSGKTTTLVELAQRIPRTSFLPPSVLFLSFNKAIVKTLQAKLGTSARASTFHSLGLAALRAKFPKIKVDFKRAGNAIFPLFRRDHPDVRTALRALALLKSTWPTLSSAIEATTFLANNDVVFDEYKSVGKVLRALEQTLEDTSSCDFDDMLVMPLVHACPFPQQDFVLVDEAQDTNDVQLEILDRLCKIPQVDKSTIPWTTRVSPTRFFFVGDPMQAIYGFRGANSDSMERIAQRFSAVSLPLSVTYRCPVLHVELARRYSSPTL